MRLRKTTLVAAFFFLFCVLAAAETTSTQQKMAAARQVIAGNPNSLQAYNDLAAALCENAEETGDIRGFAAADGVLKDSFRIAQGDYTAQKLHVAVLLGLHRWVEAKDAAAKLNHVAPDDIPVWGLLAEADLALGNYAEAQKATQWMFDLRPGNSAGFVPGAKLREAFGDVDGAIDFVNEALRRVPENERERRAILTAELGRLHLLNGEAKRAGVLVATALQLFPDCPEALRISALIEFAGGHFEQAVTFARRRFELVKTAAARYDYAEMLESAGHKTEAKVAFREFEKQALTESAEPYNANRELIFYYADHALVPLQAVELARRERAVRHDIATLDASAWALFRNGKWKEAKAEIDMALAIGTQDPGVLAHAKKIAGGV